MGVVALNWWVWSIKVGMAAIFSHTFRVHIVKYPPPCKFLDTPMTSDNALEAIAVSQATKQRLYRTNQNSDHDSF